MVITYVYDTNLYVNTTNKCDMSCEFCLRRTGPGVGTADSLWLEREPTREEILTDIRSRDWSQYAQLVFCGYGEPAYRIHDICWVIDRLKEEGFSLPIRMDTNGHGSLIHKQDISGLFAGRFDVLSISLNAKDAVSYVNRCKPADGEAAYAAMLDFTRAVVPLVPTVIMTVVDHQMTQEELAACGEICRTLGVSYRIREYSTEW